ncbi:MAG: DinB family protein [Anaerolineae bacterium]
MDWTQLFLQRYDVLCAFYLDGIWEMVSEDLMRQRPHARVNSIAWNLWHLARVEDAGLNRFVVDHPQALDEDQWMRRMNVPWRHQGTGMTFAEVDDLSQRIHLPALRDYSRAVQERTHAVVQQLTLDELAAIVPTERIRAVVIDEGLAHSQADDLIQNYTGWNKGRYLMNFCLTHPYQHVGEIGVIASLLGLEF